MQIDNPKRGFSFKVDGPLDLRLNQEKGHQRGRTAGYDIARRACRYAV